MSRQFVMAMAGQLHPLATRYHVTGERARLQVLLIRTTRYTFLMGIPICVFLSVFALPVISVWLGEELRESHTAMAWLLAALATAELFTFAGGGQGAMTVAMKRLRFPVLLNLPLAVANLAGSILLVAYTPLGVVGVAIPTLVVFIIRRIAETAYVTHITKVGLSRYLLGAYLPPVATLLILAPAAFALRLLIRPQSLPMLLLAAVLFGLSWAPVCWFVGFDGEDRKGFGRMFARIAGKVFPSLSPDRQDAEPRRQDRTDSSPPSEQATQADQDPSAEKETDTDRERQE
jgi:O-antigen/teichoic acid export membrane protein